MIQYQRLESILSVLLIIALFVLVLDLAISKGLYKICIVFIKVIVSLQILRLTYLYYTKRADVLPNKGLLIAISIPIILISLDSLLINGISERYYIKNLKSAIFIILAIWMMPFEWKNKNTKLFFYSLLVLLLAASSSNFIAVVVYSFRRIGLTSNPHYLAIQAIIVIPIAIYLLNKVHLIGKVFLAAIVIMELYLLLESYSRTAWLAFIVGSLVSIPFLELKTRLWAAGMIFFVPLSVYYLGVLDVDVRLNELINNLASEERVTIWTDAIAMQQDSNQYQWLLGHGLGGFEQDFQAYSGNHGVVDFSTPHNFLIEILYTSGLIGVLLIVIGEGLFLYALLRLWWNTTFDSQKILAVLILLMFIMHFAHTFLTISFFSKQTIYFQAVFIGVGFYLFKREKLLIGNLHG